MANHWLKKETEWGDRFIDNLARDLKMEFPDSKGFSKSNLKYMRRWYVYYSSHFKIGQQFVDQLQLSTDFTFVKQVYTNIPGTDLKELDKTKDKGQKAFDLLVQSLLLSIPWGHHINILTKTKSPEEAFFYIVKTIQNNWSRSILQEQIESDLFNRQGKSLNNFELTLPSPQSDLAREILKNPYNFEHLTLAEDVKELELEKALVQHITKFLLEMGKGFAYMGRQFNLNIEGDDFFIDLLFFNTNLNCYVVVELKVGDFKPDYAGQLNLYVNAINEQVKKDFHSPTIGLLLCKTPNKTIIEYTIKNIYAPVGVSAYKIKKSVPQELKKGLPTQKELLKELEKEIEMPENPLDEKLQKLRSIIQSNTKEEAKKARDEKIVQQLVDQLFFPLVDKIIQKTETEIKPLYHKAELTYWIDRKGQAERDVLLRELKSSGTPAHVGVDYRFDGFKSAGLKAFNNRLEFRIEFNDFKYSIHCGQHNKDFVPVEKLYHHKITDKEIDDIATKLLEVLLNEINDYAERNMKGVNSE